MRFHYVNETRDQFGNAVASASVYIYLAGTETDATIYDSNSAGSSISSSPQVTTGSDGSFEFWVDDGDYDHDQKFKVSIQKTGHTTKEIDFIDLFPNTQNFLQGSDTDGNTWYLRPEDDGGLGASKIKGDIVS